MKKLKLLLLSLLLLCSCSSKQETKEHITVYSPDGAPALGVVNLIDKEDVHIVDSSLIKTYVTGENPIADVAIVPFNLYFSTTDIKDKYTVLGSVTHGNLYMLSYLDTMIDSSNLDVLIGKKIGVINLNNVPGLIFRLMASENNLKCNIIQNDGKIASDALNLQSIDASQVGTDPNFDYYVCAEPACSVKVSKLGAKGLKIVGDLQKIYGYYPQAIAIAKKEVLKNNSAKINEILSNMVSLDSKLDTLEHASIVSSINSHLDEGLAPTLNENNLNKVTIQNCNVFFEYANKEEIEEFVTKCSSIMKMNIEGATYYEK